MNDAERIRRRAARHRDHARARVRRVTGIVFGASVALAGTIAGYVAGTGSSGTSATRTTVAQTTTAHTTTTTAQVPVPATPAAPTLLPAAPSSSDQSAAQAQTPVQAPTTVEAPPVAVSGGS